MQRSLLLLFAVAALFMSKQVSAQVMFVGYDSFCGIPTSVGNTGRGAIADIDAAGMPYIIIDPDMFANWTNSRLFVLAHECAHHKLGHTRGLGRVERMSPWGTRSQELAADCWAAKALLERGAHFDINRVIRNHLNMGHVSRGGYPSGVERARNVSRCVYEADMDVGDDFYRGCSMQRTRCDHVAHSQGDVQACSHPMQAHSSGDIIPCQHVCADMYGRRIPCHPRGDIVPCQHRVAAHPRGDLVPCTHRLHPGGHQDLVCR